MYFFVRKELGYDCDSGAGEIMRGKRAKQLRKLANEIQDINPNVAVSYRRLKRIYTRNRAEFLDALKASR